MYVGVCMWVQFPLAARRGHQLLCSWSYRRHELSDMRNGNQLRSEKAAITLNCRVIFPVLGISTFRIQDLPSKKNILCIRLSINILSAHLLFTIDL